MMKTRPYRRHRGSRRPLAKLLLVSALAVFGLLVIGGCPKSKKDCTATGSRVDTYGECAAVMQSNGCDSFQISDDECLGYKCDTCEFSD